ncbi:MAG: 30S ribosomal protein S12 methylthiotransferase RimO [Anaerolineales bacterium]|nr:30S ribosomal protein S12 methylthiotransferase RimO [Anaerolineales bacterium]
MPNRRVHIISLGCPKNTVDSASMGTLLERGGYELCEESDEADVLLVNTCGFIAPAKTESLTVLRQLAAGKKPGQILIAAGCLTQRYGAEIAREVPGVDAVMGTRRWMDVLAVAGKAGRMDQRGPLIHLPDVPTVGRDEEGVIRGARQGGSAYLEIADGCVHACAFCAIPLIKGTTVSRPIEAILHDAAELESRGVRELILIAQDTSTYGVDRGERDGLPALLEAMVKCVPNVDWIRILYAYPGSMSDRLIDMMVSEKQILPYLDLPLQHADRDILRSMKRPANMDWVHRTIETMRSRMPQMALRTTFIVGYPGETDAAFQTLVDFIQEIRFDRLGVFTFSPEEGTDAESLGDPIPEHVKEARREHIMEIQQAISLERNVRFVGQEMDVLIEGVGDGISIGRSYRDAPEIDGMVMLPGELPVGEIIPARITEALAYDLIGTPKP